MVWFLEFSDNATGIYQYARSYLSPSGMSEALVP